MKKSNIIFGDYYIFITFTDITTFLEVNNALFFGEKTGKERPSRINHKHHTLWLV